MARTMLVEESSLYDDAAYFTRYIQDRAKYLAIFERILSHIHRYRQPPGRLLDVGCGIGLLLEVAKGKGWSVQGIDSSPWASRTARDAGLDVIHADLLEAPLPAEPFDVAVFNHVLEHLPNPFDQLKRAHQMLKPTGLLIVGTPNFGSPMAWIEREHWPALRPYEHIWQFTPAVLKRILRSTGFAPINVVTEMQARDYQPTAKDLIKRTLYLVADKMNQAETMLILAQSRS